MSICNEVALLFLVMVIGNIRHTRCQDTLSKTKTDIISDLVHTGTYDKKVRPEGVDSPDGPVRVKVNMFLRDISEINDRTRDYVVAVTLRQQWYDKRLMYNDRNGQIKYLLLTSADMIWTPDLFVSNEKEGHFHDIMVPNRLVRIYPDGKVLYSVRITMTLACPMDLSNYPMDKQVCPMRMASYAHTTEDLEFVWKEGDPIQVSTILDSHPFLLENFSIDSCNSKTSTGEYSCLLVKLSFGRLVKNYLLHLYLPLGLLVLVSWIVFWLRTQATSTRVLISVIVFLSTVFESSRVTSASPPSHDTKAIDTWSNWILAFVFLALLEVVAVILIGGRSRGDLGIESGEGPNSVTMTHLLDGNESQATKRDGDAKVGRIRAWLSRFPSLGYKMDVASRIIFPAAFTVFNIVYWSTSSVSENM